MHKVAEWKMIVAKCYNGGVAIVNGPEEALEYLSEPWLDDFLDSVEERKLKALEPGLYACTVEAWQSMWSGSSEYPDDLSEIRVTSVTAIFLATL